MTAGETERYGDATVVDTLYKGVPHVMGAWLLHAERPALVDPGPASRVETLLEGIAAAGTDPADLRDVLLTHIHLDHASATGRLVQLYPQLTVWVHEAGAPHLVDPGRLIASAERIYGASELAETFGEILPVPAGRVRALSGGEMIEVAGRELEVAYTPGHAKHHVCFLDREYFAAYAGDVAGIAIPPTRVVALPTPPPDIDLEAWDDSLRLLEHFHPRHLRIAHYGQVSRGAPELLERVRERLRAWGELVRAGMGEEEFADHVEAELRGEAGAKAAGPYAALLGPRDNWQGLRRYWEGRAAE